MFCSPFRGRRQLCASALAVCGLVYIAIAAAPALRAASPDTAPPLPAPTSNVVTVANVAELQNAFARLQSGQTIVIRPGTYALTSTLYVNGRSNVVIRGETNNRNDVVLVGQGMGVASGSVPQGIWTGQGANNVTIANLTIRDVYQHPIMINAGSASPRIYNVRLVNAGEQFVKVNPDGNGVGAANGIVEYSVLEYDTTAPSGYTNGVDVHGGANWIIRHNLFRRIRSPQGQLAGPAILMWRGSSGTIVEGNTFIDCHRDIALGFEAGASHQGGIVRNNFIYRTPGGSGDVAIMAFGSPNLKIVHNTILMNGQYPSSIEARWDSATGVQIVNNLSDRPAAMRDGAQASQQGNVWNAASGWFAGSVPGDLHLLPTAMGAIDRAVATGDVTDDWDRQPRSGTADVGADEYFAAGAPPPPPPPPNPPTPPSPSPVEICGDRVDNNNNGAIDEGCAPLPTPSGPAAPSRLTGRVNGSTVSLSWLAPIVGVSPADYVLEAGVGSGQTQLTLPITQTSLTVPGVGPGRYYVRVKARNAWGLSPASNEVAVTVGCATPPSGPRAFTSTIDGRLVALNWVDPEGCGNTQYLLGVGTKSGALDIGVVALDDPSVTLGAPAGTYYARVATQSAYGLSAPSNEVRIDVRSTACQPPAFGMNLAAAVQNQVVLLAWGPGSTPAALAADAIAPIAYTLEVGLSAGTTALAFPLGRATSFVIPAPTGEYFVRVRASNVCGAGSVSADQWLRVQ